MTENDNLLITLIKEITMWKSNPVYNGVWLYTQYICKHLFLKQHLLNERVAFISVTVCEPGPRLCAVELVIDHMLPVAWSWRFSCECLAPGVLISVNWWMWLRGSPEVTAALPFLLGSRQCFQRQPQLSAASQSQRGQESNHHYEECFSSLFKFNLE